MPAPQTHFEASGRKEWTSLEQGEEFLRSLANASGRVRHLTLGNSVEGRPISAVMIGHPAPNPGNDVVMIVSGQHGLERASREAVFILARDLALSTDPAVIAYLTRTTWLMVPTASPDRVGIDRNNANNVNTNRDWEKRSQPETRAIYAAIEDYAPVLIVDAHEGRDFVTNFATSAILDERIPAPIRLESERLNASVRGAVLAAGRTHAQYPLPDGLGLLSTAAGMFHAVGLLVESRRTDDDTKPPPGERVGDQEIALAAVLEHHRSNAAAIADAAAGGRALVKFPAGGPAAYMYRMGGKFYRVLRVSTTVKGRRYTFYGR